MADLKIYGSVRSRAGRALWCARELGVAHDQIDVSFSEMKEPEFLAINPNGKVPAIVDGDLTLFESMAITLYLAKRYGLGKLYPSKIEDEARAWQWSLWAATEAEPAMGPAVGWHFFQRGRQADFDESVKKLLAATAVLENGLMARQWLAGDRFSVADLNVSSAMRIARMMNVDFSRLPNVNGWLDRCLKRHDEAMA